MKRETEKMIATIRKLLRTAADPKASEFEAMIARTRAGALMEKFRLQVSLEDDTEVVAGVRGVHWKERLLFAAARSEGCRVFDSPKGAAIAGPTRQHIQAALRLFGRMQREATSIAYIKTRALWLSYPEKDLGVMSPYYDPWAPPPVTRPPFELFSRVFFRVFINAVLDNVTQRLAPVKGPDLSELRVAMTPSEKARVERKEEKRLEEIAELTGDAQKLAAVMGYDAARAVCLTAEKQAIEWSGGWNFQEAEVLALPARSTFDEEEEMLKDADIKPLSERMEHSLRFLVRRGSGHPGTEFHATYRALERRGLIKCVGMGRDADMEIDDDVWIYEPTELGRQYMRERDGESEPDRKENADAV